MRRGRLTVAAGGLALASLAGGLSSGAGAARLADRLASGTTLASAGQLVSANGNYRLAMQPDGNLVEYRGEKVLFSTGTERHKGARLAMQRNGDLVVYSSSHKALWSSATAGHRGAFFEVTNSGELDVLSKGGNQILWTSEKPLPVLSFGSRGKAVSYLQRRLTALHYWVGPANGYFGDSTRQALYALEKVAGIARTGVLDKATRAALERGAEAKARRHPGNLVEVNLKKDLVLIVRHGKLAWVLNTSTGGGYTYTSQGVTSVATTPRGVFHVYAEIDGADVAPLGTLWRPKFFTDGDAIHGDSSVPPYPVSHGCVRVSDEAMTWIWAHDFIPMGSEVWVF